MRHLGGALAQALARPRRRRDARRRVRALLARDADDTGDWAPRSGRTCSASSTCSPRPTSAGRTSTSRITASSRAPSSRRTRCDGSRRSSGTSTRTTCSSPVTRSRRPEARQPSPTSRPLSVIWKRPARRENGRADRHAAARLGRRAPEIQPRDEAGRKPKLGTGRPRLEHLDPAEAALPQHLEQVDPRTRHRLPADGLRARGNRRSRLRLGVPRARDHRRRRRRTRRRGPARRGRPLRGCRAARSGRPARRRVRGRGLRPRSRLARRRAWPARCSSRSARSRSSCRARARPPRRLRPGPAQRRPLPARARRRFDVVAPVAREAGRARGSTTGGGCGATARSAAAAARRTIGGDRDRGLQAARGRRGLADARDPHLERAGRAVQDGCEPPASHGDAHAPQPDAVPPAAPVPSSGRTLTRATRRGGSTDATTRRFPTRSASRRGVTARLLSVRRAALLRARIGDIRTTRTLCPGSGRAGASLA